MKTKETIKWQEEQALQRYQLIAPLLDESLDNAKRIQMRETVAEQNGISPRTLYRYEAAYRKGGFPGLKPQDRETKRSPKLPENFDELLEQAIQLKREVPKRSVRQIIYILELEGRVAPGVLKRPRWRDISIKPDSASGRCRCTMMPGKVLQNGSANRTG